MLALPLYPLMASWRRLVRFSWLSVASMLYYTTLHMDKVSYNVYPNDAVRGKDLGCLEACIMIICSSAWLVSPKIYQPRKTQRLANNLCGKTSKHCNATQLTGNMRQCGKEDWINSQLHQHRVLPPTTTLTTTSNDTILCDHELSSELTFKVGAKDPCQGKSVLNVCFCPRDSQHRNRT